MLKELLEIPNRSHAVATRGGVYDPALNVWIADGFAEVVAQSSPERLRFLETMAGLAQAAGRIHLQQLSDARQGRLWPTAWLKPDAGEQVIAFCSAHPEAASPYGCVELEGNSTTPYTHQYQEELEAVLCEVGRVLELGGADAAPLIAYLAALQQAFRH